MAVAGGTDLYPNMKRRQFTPKVLVSLRWISELRSIEAVGSLELGALATLSEVVRHPAVAARWPALSRAAGLVSSPPLRNVGTIGGNLCVDTRCNYYNQSEFWRDAIGNCMKKDGEICLVAPGSDKCWALSSSDTAPVMIALDAEVSLVSPDGERRIHVRDLRLCNREDGSTCGDEVPGAAGNEGIRPITGFVRMLDECDGKVVLYSQVAQVDHQLSDGGREVLVE